MNLERASPTPPLLFPCSFGVFVHTEASPWCVVHAVVFSLLLLGSVSCLGSCAADRSCCTFISIFSYRPGSQGFAEGHGISTAEMRKGRSGRVSDFSGVTQLHRGRLRARSRWSWPQAQVVSPLPTLRCSGQQHILHTSPILTPAPHIPPVAGKFWKNASSPGAGHCLSSSCHVVEHQ